VPALARRTSPVSHPLFLICGDAGSPRPGTGAPTADVPIVLPRSRRAEGRKGIRERVATQLLETPSFFSLIFFFSFLVRKLFFTCLVQCAGNLSPVVTHLLGLLSICLYTFVYVFDLSYVACTSGLNSHLLSVFVYFSSYLHALLFYLSTVFVPGCPAPAVATLKQQHRPCRLEEEEEDGGRRRPHRRRTCGVWACGVLSLCFRPMGLDGLSLS